MKLTGRVDPIALGSTPNIDGPKALSVQREKQCTRSIPCSVADALNTTVNF